MIRFPCTCGHVFELPDDRSGGLEQCPICSRLSDVPTLSDLSNLAGDGTFLIDEPAAPADHITLGHLHEAFAPGTLSPAGEEIDFRRVAVDSHAAQSPGLLPIRVAPRYDPVTGELIRPLELNEEQPLEALPVDEDDAAIAHAAAARRPAAPAARPRSLRYATEANHRRITAGLALLELLMPANVTVLFIIFLAYFAAELLGILLSVGSTFTHLYLQVLNLPMWLLFAHYGCVIEDLGPDSMDELPRPLRFGELSDDLLKPMFHVAIALLLCFGPAMLLMSGQVPMAESVRLPVALLAFCGGALFFPSVLLTAVTGATLANLRPDRVVGVMIAGGVEYVLAIGALLVSTVLSAAVFTHPHVMPMSPWYAASQMLNEPYVTLPLTLLAVYTTHYFCWLLGMIYRGHQPQFPWVLQYHVREASRV